MITRFKDSVFHRILSEELGSFGDPAAALPGIDEAKWIVSSGHGDKPLAELRELLARSAALAEALSADLPSPIASPTRSNISG